MDADPLVSVVIPTYNNPAMSAEAVESVLAQTYPAREIIVVDDGSTEDIASLAAYEDRIQLIRNEHAGPAVARNAGLRAAKGQVFAFLDSDDLWMPAKLERCVAALREHPEAGVIYTAVRIHELDTGARYLLPQYTMNGRMARALFVECRGVNTSTLVVRRECLEKAGPFDEELFRAQDWDLMIRLAEACEYRRVPEPLTERRLHAGSLSVRRADLYAKYNLMVIRKAVARRPDLYQDLEARSLAHAHYRFGLAHYAAFRLREARREFRSSLGYRASLPAMNYYLRACLPTPTVRALRALRLRGASRESVSPGERSDG